MAKRKPTVEQLIKQEQELWHSNGYYKEIIVAFPNHKKIPLLARLASSIIRMYGGTFRIIFHKK